MFFIDIYELVKSQLWMAK